MIRRIISAALAAALALAGAAPGKTHIREWRVMPFGDSITVGQTWPVEDADGGWRTRMAPLVQDVFTYVGTQQEFGAHEGHGGWTTANLATIATAAVTASAPDYVLLMAGTNDIHQGHSAAQATADLDNLLALIRAAAPHAVIVVGQIPYVLTWSADQRAAADVYNAHIATIAGPWLTYRRVDMRGVHISGDNVHPDAVGYQWMAEQWVRFLPVHGLRPA
jgi:lysophospholipase L1-like esterase